MTTNAEIISDLRRVQAVFQLRTISTILGLPLDQTQSPEEQNNIKHTKEEDA